MNDVDALLQQLVANREDDTLRMAYADALDERGQPGDALHAELIRLQIPYEAHLRYYEGRPGRRNRYPGEREMVSRELELLAGSDGFTPAILPVTVQHMRYCEGLDVPPRAPYGAVAQWQRGFLHALACRAEDWIAHGDAVRAAHPLLTAVRCTTYLPEGVSENEFRSRWPGIAFQGPNWWDLHPDDGS